MKRLIQKESAKQVGDLYHFTDCFRAVSIIQNDRLGYEGGGIVCLTRNQFLNKSKNFELSTTGECRLTLDGDKISENYKIKPYHDNEYFEDMGPESYEQEERVLRPISPIIPYIKEVTVYKNLITNITQQELEKSMKTVTIYKLDGTVDDFVNYVKEFGIAVNIK